MAPPRAVADPNVLVAAAITPRGLCGRLLEAAIDGRWRLVVSPQVVNELTEVLVREKFRRWLTDDEARRFAADVTHVADLVPDPPATLHRQTRDPDDEYLLALAGTADVVALVLGDSHLTELANLDPPVLTPAAFLDRLQP